MDEYINFFKGLLKALVSTFDIVSDLVNSFEFMGYNASTHQEHAEWGILGIVITFIPGILSILMFMTNRTNRYNKFRTGKWKHDLPIAIFMAMFPLSSVLFQFYGVFTCQGKIYCGYIAIGVALEAFVESFFQMVLQFYTIMYGYDITRTQIATIAASFFILSKASIDLDFEVYEHDLGIWQKLLHYLKLTPGYTSTIAFRVLAFAITIAFLREWSIVPMSLLLIELVVICWISFREVNTISIGHSAYLPLIITNLGVTNVGMIGANEFIWRETKQDQTFVEEYVGHSNTFIKLSSVASFLHHVIVLSAILGLVVYNPDYFDHWANPNFILKYYEGYWFIHIYWVFTVIIGLGIIGIEASLNLGARGLKVGI